ncbi:hypothetical protein Agabi119p4_8692 [Agaricus bisporus var. burnettii]|uniref:Capsular associated protein n=1 Tax=Agaricus bisporus var. burnettii TaxID=192524 RepID=A0A8H7EXF5_AGABI|nr:hypothetical protein Agabi119p4_8692 [Agaricus bisporus var. burnettii]
MQRRRNPRISSPTTPHTHPAAADNAARSPARTLGVSNRIWLVVVVVLATLLLLHRLLPHHTSDPLPSYASADLTPTNYLDPSSARPQNPFAFCPVHGPSDPLAAKYSTSLLTQTRITQGTGHRIQRVLKRALSGQPVTISIIGGSVSSCHGAGDDPISPKCYPSKFFDWWNTIFPHPATEITNGAMRRTNSDYFGFCSAHHIPDVTDLVIVELDSDDTPDEQKTMNFEFLIRSLLNRPDQPAVLVLGHFSTQIFRAHGLTGPDHWHGIVSQFYDVPYIGTKPLLYSDYLQNPKNIQKYFVDPILANPAGHTLLADVLIAYFQYMTCEAWDIAIGERVDPLKTDKSPGLFGGVGLRKGVPEPGDDDEEAYVDSNGERIIKPVKKSSSSSSSLNLAIPPGLMFPSQNDQHAFEEIVPYCVSANDLINPLPPSIFYGTGWLTHHPQSSATSQQDVEGGATAAHYFHSSLGQSRIRIPVIASHGDIGIYYLREGVGEGGEGSKIECWVDDNYPGRKEIGNEWQGEGVRATLTMIDHSVSKGSHYVECELVGDEGQGVPSFKLVGIFVN